MADQHWIDGDNVDTNTGELKSNIKISADFLIHMQYICTWAQSFCNNPSNVKCEKDMYVTEMGRLHFNNNILFSEMTCVYRITYKPIPV